MPAEPLAPSLQTLRAKAAEVASTVLVHEAERVDRDAVWPENNLRVIGQAGLLGLHVPQRLGGLGQGLLPLALITEELGKVCASTAMCFGMHAVASKVMTVKATADQELHYLRPIAEGRHITSLALSEPGTGAHFFIPQTRFRLDGNSFVLDGQKSFVTSGGQADSYVVSVVPHGAESDPGRFTCLVLDADAPGLEWLEPWDGFGMRGNSSRSLRMSGARVPVANLLGSEGDQIWYVFEVIAPYFIVAMAGVYLGIAQAALDAAVGYLQSRRHEHTGEALSAVPVLSYHVAEMWTAIERARQLIHHAARLGDLGSPGTPAALFAAKIEVAETANFVTNTAMMLSGGRGYQQHGQIGRLLRDAQAAHVMAPTTQVLKTWLGRSVLGLPLL